MFREWTRLLANSREKEKESGLGYLDIPDERSRYPLVNEHGNGQFPFLSMKYILNPGPFFIVMLVYQSVNPKSLRELCQTLMSLEVCWPNLNLDPQEHSQIFEKAAPVLVKLSKDTFGNFLIQMLLDSATEEQVLLAGNGMKWIDMGGSFWRVSFEPIRKELPRACSLDLSYRHATALICSNLFLGSTLTLHMEE